MVVGKTSQTISKEDIFSKYTEAEILAAAFPVKSLPCRIKSPFRADNHPSFSFFLGDDEKVRYKDFGDSNEKGGLLDFLCKYWNCSFRQCLDKICQLPLKEHEAIGIKTRQFKMLTKKEADTLSKVQVAIRPWKDYDYEYWSRYGVEKQWLKYAEVYPISHKIVTKRESSKDKPKTFVFSADKYAYCFVERKDGELQLKIYQPYSKDFKWCSKFDASVWSLWTKIPKQGDNLIIGSSVKDCLNISCNLHIPAICMQGEGYLPKPQVMEELKKRYRKIIVFYDNDYTNERNPGRQDSLKLAGEYNLERVEIPAIYSAKDPSDLYFKYGKDKYLEIMHEILDPVLWKDDGIGFLEKVEELQKEINEQI